MCHLKQHFSLQAAAEAGVLQGQGGRSAGGAGRGRGRAGEGGPPQLHEEGHPQAEGGRHRHQLRQGDSTTVHPGWEAEAEYYSYTYFISLYCVLSYNSRVWSPYNLQSGAIVHAIMCV